MAGDRAPDAPGLLLDGRLGRLFEFWAADPRHQLLLFSGRTAEDLARGLSARYGALLRPLVAVFPGSSSIDFPAVRQVVADTGGAAPALSIGLLVLVGVVPLPPDLLISLNTVLFGPLVGWVLSLAG